MTDNSYVYMLMNQGNTVIYTGVTTNLIKRLYEHKQKMIEGFSKRYNLNKLVYFEQFNNIKDASAREKQIKAGSRKKKLNLIKTLNPNFKDLFEKIEIASGTSCPRNNHEVGK